MYTLMIVDDEYSIRNGLANFFPWPELGFSIVGQACNGRQALDLIHAQKPPVDVVITDIQMPVMTGLELVEALRREDYKGKIILLSAYSDFEYAREALRNEVYDYILKPMEYKKLFILFKTLKEKLDASAADHDERPIQSAGLRGLDYKSQIIRDVKEFVNEHYADVKLHDAAEHVNLSACYLSMLFSTVTNITFSEYVQQVKVRHATDMLKNHRYKVYEIGEEIGYGNSKNFSRAFKRVTGMSPREYRNVKTGDENCYEKTEKP